MLPSTQVNLLIKQPLVLSVLVCCSRAILQRCGPTGDIFISTNGREEAECLIFSARLTLNYI